MRSMKIMNENVQIVYVFVHKSIFYMVKNSVAQHKPLILITNDDSIYAQGIKSLIEVARTFGEVVVLAPDTPRSGMSHAITVSVPLHINKISETDDLKIYASNGNPADCVKLALHKLMKRKPDLILSGINHGANSSCSVLYSGTMAAALEGCINEIPSVGFSLDNYSKDADFEPAMKYIPALLKRIIQNGLPDGVCLNINIPAIPFNKIRGYKFCRQTKGKWIEAFEEREDPHGRKYFWLTGTFKNREPNATDTDEWLLKKNYITIVPVGVDFTAHSEMSVFSKKEWQLNDEKQNGY